MIEKIRSLNDNKVSLMRKLGLPDRRKKIIRIEFLKDLPSMLRIGQLESSTSLLTSVNSAR